MKLDLICPVCGKTYQRPAYRMKEGQKSYCSPSCQFKGRQINVILSCATCGKEFKINPSRIRDTFNFCSPECFYESRKLDYGEAPLCACGCGLPVTRKFGGNWHKFVHGHNFVGMQHTDEARVKMSKAAQEQSIERSQRIRGEKNPNFKHGKTNEINKQRLNWWQNGPIRKTTIARDNNTCLSCLKQFPFSTLHVHHIDHDVTNNNPANLKTLCRWCHAKLHGES